ncbi:MAG: nucleoside hydrolase [Candidatus Methylomirabilales bacterium]
MKRQPVLLDVDTGVDDALAIALALRSPELEVVGITTVSGNVPVAQATANTLLVLERLGATAVPVVSGAARPLLRPPRHATTVHGMDGLGDLPGRRPARARTAEADAAGFLLDALARRPETVLVATGPLTNVAQALQKDGARLRGLRGLWAMGGAIAVPGNVTPAAEFNVWADPEAAALVFAAGLPLTLVPLDVTERVVLPESRLEAAAARGPLQAFLRDISRPALEFHRREEGIAGLFLHDPLAVAAVAQPALLTRRTLPVAVECRGEHTAGMTVADRRRRARGGGIGVCTEVDAERFLRLFQARVLEKGEP